MPVELSDTDSGGESSVELAISTLKPTRAQTRSDDSVINETPVKELLKQRSHPPFLIKPATLVWNNRNVATVSQPSSAASKRQTRIDSFAQSKRPLVHVSSSSIPESDAPITKDATSVQTTRKKRRLVAKGQKELGKSVLGLSDSDDLPALMLLGPEPSPISHPPSTVTRTVIVNIPAESSLSEDDDDCMLSDIPHISEVKPTVNVMTTAVTKNDYTKRLTTTKTTLTGSKPLPPPIQQQRLHIDLASESDLTADEVDYAGETDTAMQQTLALSFFNDSTATELVDYTQCSPDQAEKIVLLRPFKDYATLKKKLNKTKGISARSIDTYHTTVGALNSIDKLIARCDDIGKQLLLVLRSWTTALGQETTAKSLGGMLNGTGQQANYTHETKLATEFDQSEDALRYYIRDQPNLINPELTLKGYQKVGISWLGLLFRKKLSGILADEMGLGKTAQVIAFIAHLSETGEQGPHLVVCPSSTLDNWLREFQRWVPSGLKVAAYQGSQNERAILRDYYRFEEEYHVIITTYNMAAGTKDDRAFFRKMKFHSLILDEGHMVKNVDSQRFKHLMAINAKFRLLLTGTPLQNNLQELMALLTFILPNIFLEDDSWKHVFKMQSFGDTSLSRRLDKVKKIMTPFVLRRRKLQVLDDLPAKNEKVEYCVLSREQRQFYERVIERIKAVQDTKKLQNVVMQLRKAAIHPLLFRELYTVDKIRTMSKEILREEQYWDADPTVICEDMEVMSDFELHMLCIKHPSITKHKLLSSAWMNSAKVDKLREILALSKCNDDRCLIFSQFTTSLDILEQVLQTLDMKYIRLDGQTDVSERQHLIDEFQEDKSIFIFLLSTKAGGLGLNLTAANVVILHDLDFNPHNDHQAEDRAWRLGQTRDVNVIKLVCKDTIEELIYQRQGQKLNLDKKLQSIEGEQHDVLASLDAEILKLMLTNKESTAQPKTFDTSHEIHTLPEHEALQEDVFDDTASWGTNSELDVVAVLPPPLSIARSGSMNSASHKRLWEP